jgi:hypothetical protein
MADVWASAEFLGRRDPAFAACPINMVLHVFGLNTLIGV